MNEEMFNNLTSMLDNSNNNNVNNFTNKNTNINSNNTNNNDRSNNNTSNNNFEDNFQNIFSNFNVNSSNNSNSNNGFDFSNIDMATIMKIKNIMSKVNSNKDDPKSNLLTSLKPYLRDSKKEKLDKYMKVMNLTSVIEVFNNIGGDSIK